MTSQLKKMLKIFLTTCVVGTIGEGATGWLIRLVIGKFLWTYPDSILVTTSLYVIPLWGIAGLVCYFTLQKIGVLKVE